MDLIAETIAAIRPLDEAAMSAARAHQDRLTKPRGALGVLEELSVRLAGIAGACPNRRPWPCSPPTTACTPRASPPGRRR
jgi:nicotinate-nucleotide--dimethylbenzimidazole phosphoribosyltransferase